MGLTVKRIERLKLEEDLLPTMSASCRAYSVLASRRKKTFLGM
jgi:hypothetical protein